MVPMIFWYGSHWGFWPTGLMWAGMLVFWGLLIWGIYAIIASATRRPPGKERGGSARRILDERLARGEIDAEEYWRLRDIIRSDNPAMSSGTGPSSGRNAHQ
jgi:putative membrane protein